MHDHSNISGFESKNHLIQVVVDALQYCGRIREIKNVSYLYMELCKAYDSMDVLRDPNLVRLYAEQSFNAIALMRLA